MAPEEEPKPEAPQAETAGSRPGVRRNRRAGRGRRGRGRGPRSKSARPELAAPASAELDPSTGEPSEIFELAEEPGQPTEQETRSSETPEPVAESPVSRTPAATPPARPASPASIEEAIQEVNGVVDSLRTALEDM